MIEELRMETSLNDWPTNEHFDIYDAEVLTLLYVSETEETIMLNMGFEPNKPAPRSFITSEFIDVDTIIWNPLIGIIITDINRWGFFLYEGTDKHHKRARWYIVLHDVKPPGPLS